VHSFFEADCLITKDWATLPEMKTNKDPNCPKSILKQCL
jgi:hypothetical protein